MELELFLFSIATDEHKLTLKLSNMLHVPALKAKLLSIAKLDQGYEIKFKGVWQDTALCVSMCQIVFLQIFHLRRALGGEYSAARLMQYNVPLASPLRSPS